MNINVKIVSQTLANLQIECSNTFKMYKINLKDHSLWSCRLNPKDAKIIQYTQVGQCDKQY